ncbi:MAG: hypothetical protein M3P51_08170, partial [Chloroflexota bacterium]|nr:hypothetical protein [Chloroflexota bacterium]
PPLAIMASARRHTILRVTAASPTRLPCTVSIKTDTPLPQLRDQILRADDAYHLRVSGAEVFVFKA